MHGYSLNAASCGARGVTLLVRRLKLVLDEWMMRPIMGTVKGVAWAAWMLQVAG